MSAVILNLGTCDCDVLVILKTFRLSCSWCFNTWESPTPSALKKSFGWEAKPPQDQKIKSNKSNGLNPTTWMTENFTAVHISWQKALNTGLTILSSLCVCAEKKETGLLSCCEMQLYFRFSRASEALLSFPRVNVIWRDEARGDRRKVSNGIHFIDPWGQNCFISAAAQEAEVQRLEPRVKTIIGFFFFFFFSQGSITRFLDFQTNVRASTRLQMWCEMMCWCDK